MVGNESVPSFEPLAPSLADTPLDQLTRVFVYFLQNLFRDFPEGSGLHWNPNEETSELMITAEKPTTEAIEKLPHITCIRGAGQWNNVGMDQLQNLKYSTGRRTHTDLMSMTMNYHCQAKAGVQVGNIAWFCSYYTNVLRRILMRTGGIHHVAPNHQFTSESAASAYTGPKSREELISVVVTVPFYWQVQWRIQDPAELFNGINLNLKTQASGLYSAGRLAKLRPPQIMGRVLKTAPIIKDPPEVALSQKIKV